MDTEGEGGGRGLETLTGISLAASAATGQQQVPTGRELEVVKGAGAVRQTVRREGSVRGAGQLEQAV